MNLKPQLTPCMLGAVLIAMPRETDAQACEGPVDLRTWTPESYPAVNGFPTALWDVEVDGSSVVQRTNAQPTLFVSDFDAQGSVIEGEIRVLPNAGDDDYIGFALGVQPGDSRNRTAEYLLIDWKEPQLGENFQPACTSGEDARAGLAVSRVFGIPTADELWGHVNRDLFCSDATSGVEELARGLSRGSRGWVANVPYRFRFEFGASKLRVFVNGALEIDLDGTFRAGRMAFYNFSQRKVEYSAFSRRVPASLVEYGPDSPGSR